MSSFVPSPVAAQIAIDKRLEIILIWLGFALVAFVLVLIFARYYPRRRLLERHASQRRLRRMYATGEISQVAYERELERRGQRHEP